MSAGRDLPVLVTYDWVPDFPRGFVRDLRVRWLFEEMGQAYRVETVPIGPKSADHIAMQPFGQVPILRWSGRSLFESGAILLWLAEGHTTLLPEARRIDVTQWLFSALNSVEISTLPWIFAIASAAAPQIFGPAPSAEVMERLTMRMNGRLSAMDRVLSDREWLDQGFTIADIMMADVLRLVDDKGGLKNFPALKAYVARATARPAYRRAHDDQMDHWRKADAARAAVA